MKAVVFHGIGDIRLDDVREPRLEAPTDAIVRITASAICGTDLHMVRGTLPGMKPGTILGHEAVGVVEDVGPQVRNVAKGDRVVIGSTIACGACSYCRSGYFSQCDDANPGGKQAGTAFFGGPAAAGAFAGLQAEYARIPYAHTTMVRLPDRVTDDEAILLSDIFPTGYFGADLAQITPGDTVVVFGCGPVGQFAIASAHHLRAGRVFAVDHHPDRLQAARRQGAEVIDFSADDPVETIRELTHGIGADRVIDAVGVDAERPDKGPAKPDRAQRKEFAGEVAKVAPKARPQGERWVPGDAPSQALRWAVECVAKAGTVAIIGVYPESMNVFPLGEAIEKNLTLQMGNCPHRKYIPLLIDLVAAGVVDPRAVLSQREPLTDALAAYAAFDQREPGWLKVELVPGRKAQAGFAG